MIENFKEIFEQNINEQFPEFNSTWKEIISKFGDGFVNSLKTQLSEEYQLFKEIKQFKLHMVIDNNFIFGQIKGLIEKSKPLEGSFIYRISNLKSVKIYAPPKLREELYDKIENVLTFNNQLARDFADKLLKKIIIKDAYWVENWIKASRQIGHIDQDDIPYLALAISINGHSIISKDNIFYKAGITQVWKIKDTEQVITNYNKGFISFFSRLAF